MEWLRVVLAPYDPLLKLIGYIIGPGFAVASFVRNGRQMRKLEAAARDLGALQQRVEDQQIALAESAAAIEQQREAVARKDRQLEQLSEAANDLWQIKPPRPFPDYYAWMRAPDGAKIVTFGNLKGGVGKTTLAGNFAAYISEHLQKNVLLIDLDYQGSLSGMMLQAANIEETESRIEALFEPEAGLATLSAARVHLAGKLNRGWIVPSNYSFAGRENQLLFKYVIDNSDGIDLRYRLAHVLLDPVVRREYAAIIIDMPPRLTLGTVNALFASHYFVVPTILDKLSAEAVERFLSTVRAIKDESKLDLDLAGLTATMTRQAQLTPPEPEIWSLLEQAGQKWAKKPIDLRLGTLPRRVSIAGAVGDDIAYLLPGQAGNEVRDLFKPIFDELWQRIHS